MNSTIESTYCVYLFFKLKDAILVQMSLPKKNNSQNFPEPMEGITGREIQPYVPNPIESSHDGHLDLQASKLLEKLQKMVSKSTAALRTQSSDANTRDGTTDGAIDAVPISYKVPDDCDATRLAMNMYKEHVTQETKQRTPTTLVKEMTISFQLPEDCHIDVAENTYYFHENARRTFRSTVEVAKFMLYEAYPEKPVKAESKGGLKKDYLKSEHRGRSVLKRKCSSPIIGSSTGKSEKKMHFSYESKEEKKSPKSKEKMCFSTDLPESKQKTCPKSKEKMCFSTDLPESKQKTYPKSKEKMWFSTNLRESKQKTYPKSKGKMCYKSKDKLHFSSNVSHESKEKLYYSSDIRAGKMHAKTVEKLLADAYKNLLNSGNRSFQYCDNEPTDSTRFSSESEKDVTTGETIEEFLDSAHKNLLNFFNEEETHVSKENKTRMVEEELPNEENQTSTVTQFTAASTVAANPMQEYAKLEEQQIIMNDDNHIDEVLKGPADITPPFCSLSSFIDQSDLINHIAEVSDYEFENFFANYRPDDDGGI
ncbi:hypothetical protein CJ030_MR5G003505 [Morella rubra]|uniref:Uncharacterized protein n=1 Tax=Morella rubra TaxID=262757 RepID=A0A6A1VLF8_9ROSI|nr:hypothetical protein CJ030_MR5G003505 [Morella rubra]